MKTGSCYYAIGRGTTTDQPALISALSTGHLAAAYLDVTDPEPLPPEHELWNLPNCHITPHTSGGHENEALRLVKHFVENLRRFEAGTALVDRVFETNSVSSSPISFLPPLHGASIPPNDRSPLPL